MATLGRMGVRVCVGGAVDTAVLLPPPRRRRLVRPPRRPAPRPPSPGVAAVRPPPAQCGAQRGARSGRSVRGGWHWSGGGPMFSPSQEEHCAPNKEPVKYGELVVLG